MKSSCWRTLIFIVCAGIGGTLPLAAAAQSSNGYGPGYPVREEVGTGLIDYASLRRVMEATPNEIRARIEECDSCPERESLLHQLELAERDREVLESIESAISGTPTTVVASTDGVLRAATMPIHVLREPVPCVAFYDKALSCQIAHDDRDASDLSSPCYAEQKLYRLCAQGKAKPFKAYMELQQRRSHGEVVSEVVERPTGSSVRFYNVQPDMIFPAHEVRVTPESNSFDIYVDNRTPNTLRSAHIVLAPYVPVMYGYASAFMEPWKTIVNEDHYALQNSPFILCRYALDDNSSEWVHAFWYQERPEAADPERLRERMANHPFLNIGSPVDHCPRTAAEAAALNPRQPGDQQFVNYRNVLDR